jgi:iron complex transport system substrate-binding protein
MDGRYPRRIVCLTEEPTEVLYALGLEERIVGISGFTVRPARARRDRSVDGILGYVRRLGALVGAAEQAEDYALGLEAHIEGVRQAAALLPRRPRVYFEEWDEPLITGIRWVSELIGVAGGDDVFPERALCALGKDRILGDASEVVRRAPDIILGSWCGKRFRPNQVAARAGWDAVPAVRDGELHEIKSPIILQPGPAALTDGLDAIHRVLKQWSTHH